MRYVLRYVGSRSLQENLLILLDIRVKVWKTGVPPGKSPMIRHSDRTVSELKPPETVDQVW